MTEDVFTYNSEIQTGVKNPYWDALMNNVPHDGRYRHFMDEDLYTPSSHYFPDMGNAGEKIIAYRDDMVRDYSWAIPSPRTVDWLGQCLAGRSVVEIGAGTGYWAWMLSQKGIQVTAYDIAPPDAKPNWFHSDHESEERLYTQELVDQYVDSWGSLLSLGEAFDPPIPAPKMPQVGDPYRGTRIAEGSFRKTWHPVLEGTPDVLKAGHEEDVLFLCWPPYEGTLAQEALANYQGDTLIYVGEARGGCCADDSFFDLLDEQWEWVSEDDPPILTSWSGMHDVLRTFKRKQRTL